MTVSIPQHYTLIDIATVFDGSDGEATKLLYSHMAAMGPAGEVAVNLFRAQKCSGRAKQYRGGIRGRGSYRSMAYETKQWAMNNLCQILKQYAVDLQLTWGWQQDPDTPGFEWVLYIDLPTGQVSFHTRFRGEGPDYPGEWDGTRNTSAGRIITWCANLFNRD